MQARKHEGTALSHKSQFVCQNTKEGRITSAQLKPRPDTTIPGSPLLCQIKRIFYRNNWPRETPKNKFGSLGTSVWICCTSSCKRCNSITISPQNESLWRYTESTETFSSMARPKMLDQSFQPRGRCRCMKHFPENAAVSLIKENLSGYYVT